MNMLALVTDAFAGLGGIARYNRDLLTAITRCDSANRVVVLPRHGRPGRNELPAGVRQLDARASKLGYTLAALRTALADGPFDVVFCGHLHMAPLGAIVAGVLRVPLWLQLHGFEAWTSIGRVQR